MDIANKKALVFGGTSGIGLSTCEQLIEKGADVIAISRDPSKATSVKHNKLSFESCDVRIEEDVKNVFQKYFLLPLQFLHHSFQRIVCCV